MLSKLPVEVTAMVVNLGDEIDECKLLEITSFYGAKLEIITAWENIILSTYSAEKIEPENIVEAILLKLATNNFFHVRGPELIKHIEIDHKQMNHITSFWHNLVLDHYMADDANSMREDSPIRAISDSDVLVIAFTKK